MQKSQRDSIIGRLSPEDRQNFRRVLGEVKTQLQAESKERIPARRVLEVCGDELSREIQDALQSIIKRDEMGPKIGQVPPDINLKLMGSEERVQLASFQGKRPVALVFGSYT